MINFFCNYIKKFEHLNVWINSLFRFFVRIWDAVFVIQHLICVLLFIFLCNFTYSSHFHDFCSQSQSMSWLHQSAHTWKRMETKHEGRTKGPIAVVRVKNSHDANGELKFRRSEFKLRPNKWRTVPHQSVLGPSVRQTWI